MPLYIADYLKDTTHLGALQSGAYMHLIMDYWQNAGLPVEDRLLARIAKMTDREWKKDKPILQAFFYDGWRHKRLDQELAHTTEISTKRSAIAAARQAAIREQQESKSSAIAPANASTLHTSQSDIIGSRAREPARPLAEKVSVSPEKRQVIDLGLAFVQAAGFTDYGDAPSCLYDAGERARMWIESGWSKEMIVRITRDITVASPNEQKPLAYFEKCFATAAARAAQPLPTVTVKPAENINVVSTHSRGNIARAADKLIAAARAREQADDRGSAGGGQGPARMLADGRG